ncbi:TIR domain-containing protein [Asanoa ferruginea]|uniref:TIR domain-containing protein n=1 Tax=Asanoa ferruginea TaxID=53367 RepID=A0A3D9ZHU9_9ACTN|nr:TIR domain-containing protein [Asanoa ferruginea]REF96996.1 TIR domain-containing protein [Asanoa ferruginea]GIF50186.1 hypothetical protein Afe04nite_47250 [Asanoa ferruginea]
MRRLDDPDRSADGLDFFISYAPIDEPWATWIAWELEVAGYRTMLQAWDFVPGSNFIDFMDRGVSQSVAVIAVLTTTYVRSRYGRMEWQAALRRAPDHPESKLITVRVEDFPLEGLLATITFVDLVGVDDPLEARDRMLRRIAEAMNGRAKPPGQPAYPPAGRRRTPSTDLPPSVALHHPRLRAHAATAYPPARPELYEHLDEVTFLNLQGLRFGPDGYALDGRYHRRDLMRAMEMAVRQQLGADTVHGVLVGGDLTEAGGIREFDEALSFIVGLRQLLRVAPHRVAVVPGSHDVTRAACRAYFANCEADEIAPEPPYWPKWRHFRRFFADLYDGVEGLTFNETHPWTLYEMPDLRVAVAGLNSTIAHSHREADQFGWIGRTQAAWFGHRLEELDDGWLRFGLIGHPVTDHGTGSLRDGDSFESFVAPWLDVPPIHPAGVAACLLTVAAMNKPGEPRFRQRDLL